MPTQLNIETKVDSAQKLAAVAGEATNKYLFAGELNSIVSFCNMLRGLCIINNNNVLAILANNAEVALGEVDGNFIYVLNQTAVDYYVAPVFITYTSDGIHYVQSFIGTAGNYGITKKHFVAEDFILIYQSDIPVIQTEQSLKDCFLEVSWSKRPGHFIENRPNPIVPGQRYIYAINIIHLLGCQLDKPELFNNGNQVFIVVKRYKNAKKNKINLISSKYSKSGFKKDKFNPTTTTDYSRLNEIELFNNGDFINIFPEKYFRDVTTIDQNLGAKGFGKHNSYKSDHAFVNLELSLKVVTQSGQIFESHPKLYLKVLFKRHTIDSQLKISYKLI